MRIRVARHASRFAVLSALLVALAGATAAQLAAQTAAPGTVKGFVRVNGKQVVVRHAVAVTGPDSFDPSVEVTLVLTTPTPIPPGALAKATTREDVFKLVGGNGAVVEVGKNSHNVYIQHDALGGMGLMTGGGFPEFKVANNRISSDVHTFMPGDAETLGFKVRFELAFDAPIVKKLALGKPFVPTPPPAPKPVPSGGAPKTKDEAIKWLNAQDLGGSSPTDGLVSYLVFKETWSADVVRAFLLAGAVPSKPNSVVDGYALNTAALMCEKKPAAVEIVKMLLDAGASVNQKDKDGPQATPPMLAVRCPDVLKVLLAAKPDLNIVDVRGFTVMHHALTYGPSKITAPMVRDAGFNITRWMPSLKEAGLDSDLKSALAAPEPAPAPRATPPARTSSPAAPPVVAPPAPEPRAAVDWKALGPYPQRSKAEAVKLLSRPGASTTIDDHFWDGITQYEPQRLALALQAGANVRQLRPGVNYTPLLVLADRCDEKSNIEAQVSVANQLVAAGADLTGLDSNKANALIVGALHCPVGVIQAFIKAGMPLQAVSGLKQTALQVAILASRVDVVEALLDAGVDPKKEPYNVGKFASGNKPIEAALKRKRK